MSVSNKSKICLNLTNVELSPRSSYQKYTLFLVFISETTKSNCLVIVLLAIFPKRKKLVNLVSVLNEMAHDFTLVNCQLFMSVT